MNEKIIKETEELALNIRKKIVEQLTSLGFGHIGGSLSMADIVAVMYSGALNLEYGNPKFEGRDRIISSKGHAGPVWYAALALKGYFPEEWLPTINQGGTHLPSHCDASKTPGIDITTGSLGQGLSIAVGLAYAFKLDKKPNNVYCVIGDGEAQEGQIWEAMMSAYKYKLDNLIGIFDYNKYELDGSIEDIMPLEPIKQKFESFNWETIEVDGHNVAALFDAFDKAKKVQGKPVMIIADTVKGKGIPEIEALKNGCHHMAISKELGARCMDVLNQSN